MQIVEVQQMSKILLGISCLGDGSLKLHSVGHTTVKNKIRKIYYEVQKTVATLKRTKNI